MGKYLYRCVATSEKGFVQQLVCYTRNGYHYFVTGHVKEGKDPLQVDASLQEKFNIARSPSSRSRAKARGEANIHYVRFQDRWVMMATNGRHDWFQEHMTKGKRFYKSTRCKHPIMVGPYSIYSVQDNRAGEGNSEKYRVRVNLSRKTYTEVRAFYLDKGLHWSVEVLSEHLARHGKSFLSYKPVQRSMCRIVYEMNKARKLHHYDPVPYSALKMPVVVKGVKVFV